jgi:hypothetical protein
MALLAAIGVEITRPLSTQKMGGPLGFPHVHIRAVDTLKRQGAPVLAGGIAVPLMIKKRGLFNYWGFSWIRQARNLPGF